jgi:hypothetical protein
MPQEVVCANDEKQWRIEDTAPYMRLIDGSFSHLCRKCIGKWITEGFLHPIPFWQRKELYEL